MHGQLSASPTKHEITSRLVSWGHWFAFINGVIAAMVSLAYPLITTDNQTVAASIFNIIYGVGHFTVLTFLIYLIILFPLAFAIKSKTHYFLISSFLSSLTWTLFLVDICLFSKHGIHFGMYMLDILFEDSKGMTGAPQWLILLTTTIIFLIEWRISTAIWNRRTSNVVRFWSRRAALILVLCFLSGHVGYIGADASGYIPITSQKDLYPLSYPTTARNLLSEYGMLIPGTRINEKPPKLAATNYISQHPITLGGREDYVIILIDALRNDVDLSQTMPNTMKLLDGAIKLDNHYSSGNNQADGVFGLLYGIPASYLGGVEKNHEHSPFLDVLKKNGYRIEYYGNPDEKTKLILAGAGFDVVQTANHSLSRSSLDAEIVEAATTSMLTDKSSPRLTIIQITSLATLAYPQSFTPPFQPVLDGIFMFNDDSESQLLLINRYKSSLAYVDSLIAKTLNSMPLKQTKVILTSPFGMELNDQKNGVFGFNSNFSRQQVSVPLVLYGWDKYIFSETNPSAFTTHYDIGPTIIGMEGDDTETSASGLSELVAGSSLILSGLPQRRDWAFIGNNRYFSLYESTRYTEFRKGRNPITFNLQGQQVDENRYRGKAFSRAYKEMRRYLSDD